MQRLVPVFLAATLAMAPLGTKAADLVVWWEKTFYPQGIEAVREIVTAFEQETGKQVELVQPEENEVMEQVEAVLQAGTPPDFLYSVRMGTSAARWAYNDRLVDLEGALGPVAQARTSSTTIMASTALPQGSGPRGHRPPLRSLRPAAASFP
jgi:ABC-type glycerol-3-phosphate transport system substrate-binding protein